MMAKEAFEPDMIARYGLGAEMPGEFITAMGKLGFTEDWAKKFWYGHWDPPSISQAYEFLQRRVKKPDGSVWTKDDIYEFFRVIEVAPYFRQMLIDISYRPYTRRELPRLFRLGAITEDEMYEGYLDVGVSPEKARKLTDASLREAREKERELTRADIEDGYRRGLLSKPEATEYLEALGYDPAEVSFILARVDVKRVGERKNARVAVIKKRYIAGDIDVTAASRQLTEAGATAEENNNYIELWTIDREAKVERPSIALLTEFYKRRIIAGPQLASELAGHDYNPTYIAWILANIEAEIREENERRSRDELAKQKAALKLPTKADLLSFLNAGLINTAELRREMKRQGYEDEEINRYLALEKIEPLVLHYETDVGKVQVATLKERFRHATINVGQLRAGLRGLEMPEDLVIAIAEYELVKLPPPPPLA